MAANPPGGRHAQNTRMSACCSFIIVNALRAFTYWPPPRKAALVQARLRHLGQMSAKMTSPKLSCHMKWRQEFSKRKLWLSQGRFSGQGVGCIALFLSYHRAIIPFPSSTSSPSHSSTLLSSSPLPFFIPSSYQNKDKAFSFYFAHVISYPLLFHFHILQPLGVALKSLSDSTRPSTGPANSKTQMISTCRERDRKQATIEHGTLCENKGPKRSEKMPLSMLSSNVLL